MWVVTTAQSNKGICERGIYLINEWKEGQKARVFHLDGKRETRSRAKNSAEQCSTPRKTSNWRNLRHRLRYHVDSGPRFIRPGTISLAVYWTDDCNLRGTSYTLQELKVRQQKDWSKRGCDANGASWPGNEKFREAASTAAGALNETYLFIGWHDEFCFVYRGQAARRAAKVRS